MAETQIILKPGIPGVSRPTKADKNPVRHIPKDSQEFKIIAAQAVRDAERRAAR